MIKQLVIFGVVFVTVFSCVPTRQFQELKEKNEYTVIERDSLKSINESLTVNNTEMEAEREELKTRMGKLAQEKSDLKDSVHFYKRQYKVYEKMYTDLTQTQQNLEKGRDAETRKLLAELQVTKEDLQMQEDDLRTLEASLIKKEMELEARDEVLVALDSVLNQRRLELDLKSQKVKELEQILHSKDSAVLALKNKITDALLGFENKGLTIQQRNGKVYVTMDEKLLFKSGSWTVDTKGQQAIKQIAGVLAKNKDINIVVEGHTDDVPMHGSGEIKDNWDLSVKRATAIVKILLQNSSIDKNRVTAAGRGPYSPIDPAKTPEARAKNRRTEIILTPKLDELFQILETN